MLHGSQDFTLFDIKERLTLQTPTETSKSSVILYVGESREERESSLSVAYSLGVEAPLNKVVEFENAHSPAIEKIKNSVIILFTAGANTTCVARIEILDGLPKHVSTETIAWNDSGAYRTSESYPEYRHLIEKRKHIKAE